MRQTLARWLDRLLDIVADPPPDGEYGDDGCACCESPVATVCCEPPSSSPEEAEAA